MKSRCKRPSFLLGGVIFICGFSSYCWWMASPVQASGAQNPRRHRRKVTSTIVTDSMVASTAPTTKILDPRICDVDGTEACQHMESMLVAQKEWVKQERRLHVLVLLVQFADHENDHLVPVQDLQDMFQGPIQEYIYQNSQASSLEVDFTLTPWTRINHTESDCAFGVHGLTVQFQDCFAPVLHQVDDDDLATMFDADGDGVVDRLVVLHSGLTNKEGGVLVAHAATGGAATTTKVGPYVVASGHEGHSYTRTGMILHQFLLTLGLEPLYDRHLGYDYQGGVGRFSILSHPGSLNDTQIPPPLDPWSKIQLGWTMPIPINSNGRCAFPFAAPHETVYKITLGYAPGEYLLVEYRPSIKGFLVWHIDESRSGNTLPTLFSKETIRQVHPKVALLQADGQFELETGVNGGNIQDVFVPGDLLGTTPFDLFREASFPNLDSYHSYPSPEGGLWLSEFRDSSAEISFVVHGFPTTTEATQVAVTPFHDTVVPVQHQCIVRINTRYCTEIIEKNQLQPIVGCDCYQWCGDQSVQQCCKFGEICPISCKTGGLVAGCTFPEQTTTTTNIVNEGTPPASSDEEDNDPPLDDASPTPTSGSSSSTSSIHLAGLFLASMFSLWTISNIIAG